MCFGYVRGQKSFWNSQALTGKSCDVNYLLILPTLSSGFHGGRTSSPIGLLNGQIPLVV